MRQLSPLRYPGGKTWLVPHIHQWLSNTRPRILIEPFAGGGIVSLTAIMTKSASVRTAYMYEKDPDIAAFWRIVLSDGEIFASKVRKYTLTRNKVMELERDRSEKDMDVAFRTLVLNRTRRAGILAPGASFIKYGEGGKGISSRWYPNTLADRIIEIYKHRRHIKFEETDGVKSLKSTLKSTRKYGPDVAVFVDPPYTFGGRSVGSRLYMHNEVEHERIFSILKRFSANFLMTYNHTPEIGQMIDRYGFHAVKVRMRNAHYKPVSDLLITKTPTTYL